MSESKTRLRCGSVTDGLLVAVFFLSLGGWSRAADPAATLEQSLSQAMEKSPAIVVAKAKIAMAQAELSSTQLEIARQVIVLWGNWETQKSEAAAARRELDRLTAAKRNSAGVTEAQLDQARRAVVDAEAKLSRTQTELRYVTGQVSLQGGKETAGGRGNAGANNPSHAPVESAPPVPRESRPPAAAKARKGCSAATPETALRMVHGLTADKIREILNKPADLHFQAAPLSDVIASLAEKYHLDIRLDNKTLAEASIPSDTPITASLSSMTLKAALTAIFLDTRLAWVVQDGALLITTKAQADNMLVTVIYPVLDLLPPPPKGPQKQTSPRSDSGQGRGGTERATPKVAAQGREPVSTLGDWDALVELLTNVIQPTSWDSVGGPGSIAVFDNRGVLVISQTEEIQAEIAEVLDLLRKGASVAPQSASNGVQPDSYRGVSEALDRPVQLNAAKKPLAEVMAMLEENCKIPIRLDREALERAGIAPDLMVTLEIRGLPLRSVLRLLLEDPGLTYTIAGESLLVTTPEGAESHLPVVVYPVGDLVTTPGQTVPDFDTLIDMLTSTIQPASWDSVGGFGAIAPLEKGNLLAVRQTLEVQEEIGRMLKGLWQYPVAPLPAAKP